MKAIMVSVDYSDLLAISLKYNRHHFEEVMVVTSFTDVETVKVCQANNARAFMTNAFYENGAVFNKFLALEQGLDFLGRDGWICVMDSDVLWPRDIKMDELSLLPQHHFINGCLYTPRRRMFEDVTQPIPQENEWGNYPLHPQSREFAGYTQIFHASDLVLGPAPWHDTRWKHCGGADSEFQNKWKDENKIRPPWEILHLGPAGTNWCGRASTRVDGSIPDRAGDKIAQVRAFIRGRTQGPTRFDGEKVKG